MIVTELMSMIAASILVWFHMRIDAILTNPSFTTADVLLEVHFSELGEEIDHGQEHGKVHHVVHLSNT